jgi:hypothetical protein
VITEACTGARKTTERSAFQLRELVDRRLPCTHSEEYERFNNGVDAALRLTPCGSVHGKSSDLALFTGPSYPAPEHGSVDPVAGNQRV